MKTIRLFVLLFPLNFSVILAQVTERDTVFDRFRSVNIQNGKVIQLQSNIKTLKEVVIKSSSDQYYLKKGSFIRADSIGIEVNRKGQILAITFAYNADYGTLKLNYAKPLGEGMEYEYISGDLKARVTKWEDQKTSFELAELIINGKILVFSSIYDKELFLAKMKHCNPEKLSLTSWILFRLLVC